MRFNNTKTKIRIIAMSAAAIVAGWVNTAAAESKPSLPAQMNGGYTFSMASMAKILTATGRQEVLTRIGYYARLLTPSAAMDGIDRETRTATIVKPDYAALGTPAKAAKNTAVFGSLAIGFNRLPAVAKLNAIKVSNAAADPISCENSTCDLPRAAFARTVDNLRDAGFMEKIRSVNALVNSFVRYRRDADTSGRLDYWATPEETLTRRSGDCEDYAILKMAALTRLGLPESSMSIVILRDESRNLFHAILAVRTNQGFFILDNMRKETLRDRDLPQYMPLYSVSAGKGYLHGRKAKDGQMAMSRVAFDKVAPGEGPGAVFGDEQATAIKATPVDESAVVAF